jgi:hypothetical protein
MPPPAKKLDFGPYAEREDYMVEANLKRVEDADDKAARLARETADANHARWKATAAFAAVLVGVAAVAGACLYLAVREGGSPDDRKWAMTILGSIVSAGVGFLTGRNQGR